MRVTADARLAVGFLEAQRFADQCGEMVRERPVTMLAAAAAIGYLIGRVFR